MRLVSINNCESGMVLAKPIYNEDARLLLNVGTTLTEAHINRIKKRIAFIYIKSEMTDDIIQVNDDIPYELRTKTIASISNVFSTIRNKPTNKVAITNRLSNFRSLKETFSNVVHELQRSSDHLNLISHLQINNDSMFEHSLNTSLYSLSIGRILGIPEKSLHILGLGALFHDIGKLQLPKSLLSKTDLTDEEKQVKRSHTEIGFEMLRKESELHLLVAHCAYQHHENVDGSGYPRGLKKNEIHQFARIITVAEKFDQLIREKAMLPHEAMEVLYGYCYIRYDIEIIDAFKKAVAIFPIGVTVTLSTGEQGVVIGYNQAYPQRPKVRIFRGKDGKKLSISEFYDIDLLTDLTTMIVKCDAIIERKTKVIK
ncbi:HD-GYP domain-containing protein [Bacillus sp. SG-1]|uniref:HD-GYP domain-containing protein n=1 Tax=Bacillus sp. SG-1 TaxID=161544 RepID=UPI0002FC90BD|nr:HD domain-containing phosphohydrolase [Bacillus sp. SG-1]